MTRPDTIHRLTGRTIIFSASGNDPSHDALPVPLPDGRTGTVKGCDTDTLRGIFAKFGIENVWTDGRAAIVSRWADFIGKVYAEAGEQAVQKLISERRRYE